MHDRNDISKLAFERGVEVGAALNGAQTIGVGQLGEYADVAAVFELNACRPKFLADQVRLAEIARTGSHRSGGYS